MMPWFRGIDTLTPYRKEPGQREDIEVPCKYRMQVPNRSTSASSEVQKKLASGGQPASLSSDPASGHRSDDLLDLSRVTCLSSWFSQLRKSRERSIHE